MRRFMILFLSLFTAVFVFGDMLHSDYQVSNDRVYLINPIFYENIKVKDAGNGRYEVTDTGDFNFISNSGRNIAFSLKNGELTGSFTEYYENGLKLSEGSYVNGKKMENGIRIMTAVEDGYRKRIKTESLTASMWNGIRIQDRKK